MPEKGQITEDTCKYLTVGIAKTQLLYKLPKIHKGLTNTPGRPTVSRSAGSTEKNKLHFISPLVRLTKFFVRDSTHIINILNDIMVHEGM